MHGDELSDDGPETSFSLAAAAAKNLDCEHDQRGAQESP